MKTANKGWDCCGNAQASVDDGCQIILACDVTAECNDKRQAVPMAQATRGQLDQAGIAPAADETGARPQIPAALDTGYFSAEAVAGLERAGFDPHIATERQRHHARWRTGRRPAPESEPAAGRRGDGQGEDAGEAEDGRGASGVRAAEGDRGAGVWPDQGGAGISAVPAAWPGEDPGRMAAGVPDP